MKVPIKKRPLMRGLALVMVLWIVAALSLMVMSLSQTVRQQIQITAGVSEQVNARALASGAIALALQQMKLKAGNIQRIVTLPVEYAGTNVSVQVMPLNGLISLNTASTAMFMTLLHVAGGLSAPQAARMAQDIVDWRAGRSGDPTRHTASRTFESVQDLLQMPGMTYALYERLSPLVTADTYHQSSVNPLAAPPSVLTVLTHGNTHIAARIASHRDAGDDTVDLTGLDGSLAQMGATSFYRLTARVALDAGRIFSLSHDVALSGVPLLAAPWRTLRTQWQIQPASPEV